MRRQVSWSRDALDDLKAQIAYIAAENPGAARRVADALHATAEGLAEMPTGRPGRVTGTYEKSVTGLPYIIAYTLTQKAGRETVSIVRVVHTSRDWPDENWAAIDYGSLPFGKF